MEDNMNSFFHQLLKEMKLKTSNADSKGTSSTEEMEKALDNLVTQKFKIMYASACRDYVNADNKHTMQQINETRKEYDVNKEAQKKLYEAIEMWEKKNLDLIKSTRLKVEEIIKNYDNISTEYTPDNIEKQCEEQKRKNEELRRSVNKTKMMLEKQVQKYDDFNLEINPAIELVFNSEDDIEYQISSNKKQLKFLMDLLDK